MPQPTSDDEIGFFSGSNEFLIYNISFNSFIGPVDFLGDLLYRDWSPGPVNFPGEEGCGSR